jgi:hypothetical protein
MDDDVHAAPAIDELTCPLCGKWGSTWLPGRDKPNLRAFYYSVGRMFLRAAEEASDDDGIGALYDWMADQMQDEVEPAVAGPNGEGMGK